MSMYICLRNELNLGVDTLCTRELGSNQGCVGDGIGWEDVGYDATASKLGFVFPRGGDGQGNPIVRKTNRINFHNIRSCS